VANVENDSTIEKDSVKLYVNVESSDFYPVPSPMLETPEKMERNGEETMEETFKKVGSSSDTSSVLVIPTMSPPVL
jgi:hypothetical protein